MAPSIPPLVGNLRLATRDDITRMANVGVAGFYYDPTFHAMRPHHAQHPRTTMLSSKYLYTEYLRRPNYVTVVIEDTARPNEDELTKATIDRGGEGGPPTEGQRVVVGLATWEFFQEGSSRVGQFNDPSLEPTERSDKADADQQAITGIDDLLEECRTKYAFQ